MILYCAQNGNTEHTRKPRGLIPPIHFWILLADSHSGELTLLAALSCQLYIYIYLFVWRVSHSLGLKGVHVLNSLSGMCVPVNLFEYQKNETTESNMTSIKVFLSYPSNPKKVQELHGTITFSVYHFSSPQLKKQSKVSSFVVAPEVQVAKSLQYSNQWTLNVVEPGSIPEWRPPLQRRLPRPTGHTDLVSHRRTKGEYPAGRDFWNLKHIHLDSKIPCRDTYLKTGSFITYTCCGMETGESF